MPAAPAILASKASSTRELNYLPRRFVLGTASAPCFHGGRCALQRRLSQRSTQSRPLSMVSQARVRLGWQGALVFALACGRGSSAASRGSCPHAVAPSRVGAVCLHLRVILRQRLGCALAACYVVTRHHVAPTPFLAFHPRPLSRCPMQRMLALSCAISRCFIAPIPGLASHPRLQPIGSYCCGSLSRTGELDAGGVFGGG